MKNIYTLLIYFIFIVKIYAAPGDTTHVQFHNKTDMTWYGNYDLKGAFPSNGKTWNKIILKYTLGCASTGCSGWDYTTHIQYLKPTGKMDSSIAKIDTLLGDTSWNVFEVKEKIELARVITPYGTYMKAGSNGYTNNWQQAHWFDVTDYVSLLHDSATLRAFYSGWSSGFSCTLDFYFIEGTPPRPVISIDNIWGAGGDSYGYANTKDFETKYMPAKKVYIPLTTKSARLTFIPSGHGFDNTQGAAEFYDETFYVKTNGTTIATDHIWNDQCGQNPVFPQGGTWVYNRANWCPGSKVGIFSYEIGNKLKADTNILDIDFEPYSWTGNQQPSYTISSMLFQYGDYNYTNEASIEDIISPSKDSNYIRLNPICSNPIILIKNYGKDDLTSLEISYGLNGNTKQVYMWKGKIAFGESQLVNLPMLNWAGVTTTSTFEVTIDKPNDKTDELAYNNKRASQVLLTQKLENKLVVWFKSNASPTENAYTFKDADGKVLFSKSGFAASTIHKDTVSLPDGCITFELTDEGGDGIDWWANKQTVGSGYIWLKNVAGNFTKKLNPDFGNAITFRFNTTFGLAAEEVNILENNFDIYPNPAQNILNIQAFKPECIAKAYIYDMSGKLIRHTIFTNQTKINTEAFEAGIYIVKIDDGEGLYYKKVLVER